MKNTNILIISALLSLNLQIWSIDTYIVLQNDTNEPIDLSVNNIPQQQSLYPGGRKEIPTRFAKTISAKYQSKPRFSKLNLNKYLKQAREEGAEFIVHLIKGTFNSIKIGTVKEVFENISVPLNVKMLVLGRFGLKPSDVFVKKLSRNTAAKILDIPVASTFAQAEKAQLDRFNERDKYLGTRNEAALNYFGYLSSKAVRAFKK